MPTPTLDIPVTAPTATATMEQTHVRVSVTPNDDAQLGYDLAVPKTWAYSKQFGPTASGLLQTQGIGFWTPTLDANGPVIAATVTVVPFEVPIDTWARLDFAHDGWEILDGKWFPGPFGLFYDLTGVRERAGTRQVRRTTVRVRGTQIFSLNSMCGYAQWDHFKEIIWIAHVSFELTLKGSTRMEPWHGAIAERPDFQVGYPASWSSESKTPEPGAISLVDVRLLNAKADTLLAYLQVTARRREAGEAAPILERCEHESQALLQGAGLLADAAPRQLTREEDPRAEAVSGWLGGFACEGTMKGGRVYARTGFLDRNAITFIFTLLSPLLADDNLTALRAQRAFEIARASLVLPA